MMPGFLAFFKSIKFVNYLLALVIPDFFGIGVPAFAAESGSGIVFSRSMLPGSDVKKTRHEKKLTAMTHEASG